MGMEWCSSSAEDASAIERQRMSHLILRAMLGISLLAASIAPAGAQTIPSGSYQQSCTNVHTRGDQLVASCTSSQGGRVRSSIALDSCRGDIANYNGQLTCNVDNSGNGYRHNHRNGSQNGGNGNYGGGNGNYGGGNGNYGGGNGNYGGGNGNYGGGNGNYGGSSPAGSYQQTCRNTQMRGGVLTSTCPEGNGNLLTTSLNVRQCGGADIANRNGRLTCQ
jgi:CVNH domain